MRDVSGGVCILERKAPFCVSTSTLPFDGDAQLFVWRRLRAGWASLQTVPVVKELLQEGAGQAHDTRHDGKQTERCLELKKQAYSRVPGSAFPLGLQEGPSWVPGSNTPHSIRQES